MASLYEYLYHDRVVMLERRNKAGVLEEMHQLLAREHLVSDPDQVFEKILQREEEGSTGLGQSVAIPHVRLPEQKDLHMLIGFSEIGIDYDSVDGQPVHLIFMIYITIDSLFNLFFFSSF